MNSTLLLGSGSGSNTPSRQAEFSAEVRYALPDWGKIPLNPTLYLECAHHYDDPNTLEGILLLGRWSSLICLRSRLCRANR